MKKLFVLCFFTFIAYLPAWSQTTASDEISLPSSICVFSGDFQQSKHLKGLLTPIESNGQFFYHCDLGVIWKTTSPIEEILILTNIGESYRIEDGQQKPLKSQQSKLLSELINGLIGANQSYIDQNFTVSKVSSSETEKFTMFPKKRRLKRGLKQINLSFSAISATSSSEKVLISMLDRNKQWTHITSIKNFGYTNNLLVNSLDKKDNLVEQCAASTNSFSALECQLLFQSCQIP